jgi:murein DD-endopeptidase MepM/ murein hydrolase activator NlpD
VVGKTVTLEIEVADPMASTSGSFVGQVKGKQLVGTLTLGGVATPVSFQRARRRYTVESWVMGEDEIDARALRWLGKKGAFRSGGYVGLEHCDFLSCAGDLTAWDVTGDDHAITAASGGGCPSSSSLMGTWNDAEKVLLGTYAHLDCGGASAGDFLAGKGGVTKARHLRGVLRLLARLADRVEAESLSVLDLFSESYLNDGKTRADWQADFVDLYDDFESLEVAIAGVDEVATIDDPEVNPLIGGPPRVGWHLVATGDPSGGGPTETVADAVFERVGNQQLLWIGKEKGRWVFVGNGYSEPFAVDLPIDSFADSTQTAYRLWPFGVHGGGHPEGHAGWDFEYAAGAEVHAAADGTVTSVEPNDTVGWDLVIEHRPGIETRYHHVENLAPGVVEGAAVSAGEVLGDPGDFGPGFRVVHFALSFFTGSTCPTPYLTPAAKALFDAIWVEADYTEELVEPFPCQPEAVAFPLVRQWDRTAGALAPRIDFSRNNGMSTSYGYELRNAIGVVTETGTATVDPTTSPPSIDLVPNGGGPTHLGVYDVVSSEMLLDWDDLARPASLAGASTYQTSP